ncbi:hypothetical protein BU23DRAFT_288706 [Bimuria novae-zelandiae CBS 107.79]|uniref:Uncharacterized protein n=1 Tax=Bimuria novae-zelandiae CBS 107.79 TaxID=1447943 RepID=A0A6A5URQ1_9PLEO|nr:hypothetical protein BU23DRAFT_288706 [Bimuria novae-zelandiae CBS 107.79]
MSRIKRVFILLKALLKNAGGGGDRNDVMCSEMFCYFVGLRMRAIAFNKYMESLIVLLLSKNILCEEVRVRLNMREANI